MFAIRMPVKPIFKVELNNNIPPVELKFALRAAARDKSLYFSPIPETITVENDGKKIEINTLGRWLFGTPGFAGHYRQQFDGNTVIVSLPEYEPAIKLIRAALEILKTQGVVKEYSVMVKS